MIWGRLIHGLTPVATNMPPASQARCIFPLSLNSLADSNNALRRYLSLPSNQPSPQHIQRRLRSPPANQFPITRQYKTFMFGVRIIGERDVNQTHRLLFTAAVRTGDSRHCQSKISLRAMTYAARHVARHLL